MSRNTVSRMIIQGDHVLRFIAKTLHAEYSTSKVQPYDLDWKVGELCIAQYHGNKKWYRAQVVRMTDNNMIEVIAFVC